MAENSKSFYLFCSDFFHPNGTKCDGELTNVGPESGGRYVTRLKYYKCSRVIHIQVTDLHRMLEDAKQRAYQASTRD